MANRSRLQKKKQQEIKEDNEEDEDEDNSEKDPVYRDCPVYGSKKKLLKKKLFQKNL